MLFVLKVCIKHVTLKYYQNVGHNTKQMLKFSLQKTVFGNVRRERAFFMSLCDPRYIACTVALCII